MREKKGTRRIWIQSVRRNPPDANLEGRAFYELAAAEAQREADAQAQAEERTQPQEAAQLPEEEAS
jgi:hypothetical protein